MAYQRKTKDVWVLQVKYCEEYGYEDEVEEPTLDEARKRRREYIENCPQYPCRIVCRRVPLTAKA